MIDEGVITPKEPENPYITIIRNAPDSKLPDLLKSFCRRYDVKYTGGDIREWLTYQVYETIKLEKTTPDYVVEVNVSETPSPLPPDEEATALAEYERKHDEHQAFALAHSNDNCTDYGNADRFLNLYGLDVKFCKPFNAWYIWNEKEGRWKRDGNGEPQELAKKTVRSIYREAERAGTEEHRKTLARWAMACETTSHTNAILTLACSDPWVVTPPDSFDIEPSLINMTNGVYDLEHHKLIPHSKERLITKTTGIVFDPNATCPLWEGFMDRIFQSRKDKDEMISFLQRAIGYSLTGKVNEQVLMLLYGKGQNGKSVLLSTIDRMMGEYAYTADSSSFTTAKSDKVRNDIAAFSGKRFIQSSEITKTAVLDEALIKKLTGGENITARFLYQEDFTFTPTFKLWLAFNHRPDVRDRTYSIWRRILLIPFEETIPESEQDKQLVEKLIAELPGIFNWALHGLKEYQETGLNPPESVKIATQEYRHDTDVLFDFFNEICIIDNPNNRESSSELYNAYRQWCAFQHELDKNVMSASKFGRELNERFRKERTTRGVFYWGIGLNQSMYQKVIQEGSGGKYGSN